VVPGHKNWQIETAVWNLAGFLTVGLETHWQGFGQSEFLDDLWKQLSGLWPVSSLLVQKPADSDLGSFLIFHYFLY